ncbi:MAG: AAA family ATPase [Thermodesulfobacteriota bacterium]
MKIETLRLSAFGPFTDKRIDFSGNENGLHLVLGANEAGKSTALRAILCLLYGFGHKVEDAWLHGNNKMEVGGTLMLEDGNRLNLTRYKRRRNDLINADTGQICTQTELDIILGRMDRQAFEHAFGISHHSLRQGVESVLAAGGELGQALFAATSGLNTLKHVMNALAEKQNSLFTPRAQNAVINAGISKIEKLRKELRDVSANHQHWKQEKNLLDNLQEREIKVAEELSTLSAEISMLSRYRDASKYVSRQIQLQIELDSLGRVPNLEENFSERRIATQLAIKVAEQNEQNLVREIMEIDRNLDTLTFDKEIIAHEKMIEGLAKEVNVHTTAAKDSKKLRADIHRHRETGQQNLNLLRPGLSIDNITAVRLTD